MDEAWQDFWPLERLGEAFESLAGRAGLSSRTFQSAAPPPKLGHERHALAHWFDRVALAHGCEVIQIEATYEGVEPLLTGATPALFQLTPPGEPTRFLAVLRATRNEVQVLCPDGRVCARPMSLVLGWLRQLSERAVGQEIDALLAELSVPEARRRHGRQALLKEKLQHVQVGGCWALRLPASAPLRQQLRDARVGRTLGLFAAGSVLYYALWGLAWYLIGRSELGARLDWGGLQAWVLVLLSLVPLIALVGWSQGRFAIGFGMLFKQRLLAGALRLPSEQIRRQGSGGLFGLVLESEALESAGLNGGFLALLAALELAAAALVLGTGAGGSLHVLALLAWLVLTGVLAAAYARERQAWCTARLEMTHDMVENIVGHSTRLVQQAPERLHDDEDQALERYLAISARMDRAEALLLTLAPRGWTLVGLGALAPAYVVGTASMTGLALALGGVLLAAHALQWLSSGILQLIDARIAWHRARPLFQAGGTAWEPGDASMPIPEREGLQPGTLLMEGRQLRFAHPGRPTPVLQGTNLEIWAGDRILLEGSSGTGKSTLVSLLAGLRQPTAGLLLSGGLDYKTLGELGWGRQVAVALQPHENHVVAESFAFNLLMGRAWTPHAGDLEEAHALCQELGLGELIARMPAGLFQQVGELGWQLSHGERSRLFIARALLQGARVIILDESLAALDPDTLARTVRCLERHTTALLLIAHGAVAQEFGDWRSAQ